MWESLNGILAHHTGQDAEKISHDVERDFILGAESWTRLSSKETKINQAYRPPALKSASGPPMLGDSLSTLGGPCRCLRLIFLFSRQGSVERRGKIFGGSSRSSSSWVFPVSSSTRRGPLSRQRTTPTDRISRRSIRRSSSATRHTVGSGQSRVGGRLSFLSPLLC